MQRSTISRKLRPAKAAIVKVAAALRLGRSLVSPSKAFKRTASRFSVRVAAVLSHRRRRRLLQQRILFKRSPTRRRIVKFSKLPLLPPKDDVILAQAAAPLQIELLADVEERECAASSMGNGSEGEISPGADRLEGVDLRAELFIAKIREQMRRELQRCPP